MGKKRTTTRLALVPLEATSQRSLLNPRIPMRWVNFVIGLFLLPVAAVWSCTFFSVFSQVAHRGFWITEEFWFFALGCLLWVIAFAGLPRPLILYVFGHELTHALWAWMMGGRVSKIHVSRFAGYVVTDKRNLWIALAPYFFPLYSVLVIAAWAGAAWFVDLSGQRALLFALIGITWAFHVSFTLWAIPRGQTDLTYYGTFFSLVVIYLMNLLVLTLFLIAATPHVTLRSFGLTLLENAEAASSSLVALAQRWPG